MSIAAWLAQLENYQRRLLGAVRQFSAADYNRQYHPELSPAGWHLGHCLVTENYWLREVILEREADAPELKGLYVPELSPKPQRAAALPALDELCAWVAAAQAENRRLLAQLQDEPTRHPLLAEAYLHHFLCQHYAQHYETVMYIRAQRQMQAAATFKVVERLEARAVSRAYQTLHAADYAIGNQDKHCPYDNERPAFEAALGACRIARRPVSNAEFLGFIEADGYTTRAYWSERAWRWLQAGGVAAPAHWREDDAGNWFGLDESGAHHLPGTAPVYGISHHEALAFANWAAAGLPHEYEWEAAQQAGLLQASGMVWEWCANAFHPYAGFAPFPYAGYSRPYFDDEHYVLRGGSIHTLDIIRRASFRNYYQADKRHQHAGLRLVF